MTEAHWEQNADSVFQVELYIRALDRPKITADIMEMVNDAKVHISAITSVSRGIEADINISIDVADLDQMYLMMDKIRAIKDVLDVRRNLSGN